MSPSLVQVTVVGFVLASALGAALLKDVLSSVIVFAAYSLGIAILWVLLQAPDVGLTEAAVGAGVMTILFLLALANTVRPSEDEFFESVPLTSLAVVGAFVLAMAATVPALPPVGAAESPVASGDVSRYYLEHAVEQTGVHNVVTAVLASYRGFDTFGEATVVYAGGVAALVVLKREAFA